MAKHNEFEGLTYGRGYVYSLQYHIVWCTKYRTPILIGDIAEACENHIRQMAEEYHFNIITMEVMPDHIHLLLDCKPQFNITDMVKIMKGNTARWLFMQFKQLKQQLYGGHLWNPTYCAVTVSERSLEQVKHYIDTQQ